MPVVIISYQPNSPRCWWDDLHAVIIPPFYIYKVHRRNLLELSANFFRLLKRLFADAVEFVDDIEDVTVEVEIDAY